MICEKCKAIQKFLERLVDDAKNAENASWGDLQRWIEANGDRAAELLALTHE